MPKIIWKPSEKSIERSALSKFVRKIEAEYQYSHLNYNSLHSWSIKNPENFWLAVLEFSGVKLSKPASAVLNYSSENNLQSAKWFLGAELNFAENLLERGQDSDLLLISLDETGTRNEYSRARLKKEVAKIASYFLEQGLAPGDRVAGICKNSAETLVCSLAAISIGAVWCCCSPDFGETSILDRFQRLEAKILVVSPDYYYGEKYFNCSKKLSAIIKSLNPSAGIIVLSAVKEHSLSNRGQVEYQKILESSQASDPQYTQLPFNHPLYILFSSGTTGLPKCIIHGAGGTLLQHLKEHSLHLNFSAQDTVFYHTTCGWMMWNWLISALASNCRIVLYDGGAMTPEPNSLFKIVEKEKVSVFGTSARFLLAAEKAGVKISSPSKNLRAILSTGSPLIPEQFDYVYQNIAPNCCLSSISGGTDIISCFALGAVSEPVQRGRIQVKGLGMDIACFSEQGDELLDEPGELVCRNPFPSMPIGFWQDPEGEKYSKSYFSRFKNIWHHGDWIEIPSDGGLIIYGRSDTTLNPAGVRIGTAEIYRLVETFSEVRESIAVGQNFEGSERIILFVIMDQKNSLKNSLKEKIRKKLKSEASPRHVPAKIIEVPDIPRTRSGKVSEIAVKKVIHGKKVLNSSAFSNPEALTFYENIPELDQP